MSTSPFGIEIRKGVWNFKGEIQGYGDRLADRSIAVPRIAIAEDGVASRYQRREEPSRISVLDNATGGGRIVQTVKLRR